MRQDEDEPIVTDEEIEEMRLSRDDLERALAVCERGIKEARRRAQYAPEIPDCCADGWKLYEKGGETFAEPCETHFPEFIPPDDRTPPPGKKKSPKDKEALRESILARVRKEFE